MSSPAAPRLRADDIRERAIRAAVAGYGATVLIVAVALWIVQLDGIETPCTVPHCSWPRLSEEGFAALGSLGLRTAAWTGFAIAVSVLCIVVPFGLGVIVARTASAPPLLPVVWFTMALGAVSSVLPGPLGQLLRLIALAAWFT
ncbi:MAG: hypothetical protein JST33_03690, partial [Actinobacteria bacterium]|nr:hypothetical protein [Actinomycetota bacterium]